MPHSSITTANRAVIKPWIALFALTLGAFTLVASEFIPAGILNHLIRAFNISAGTAGLVITITAIGAFIAAPLVTVLAGNLDRRLLLIASTCLMLITNMITLMTPNFSLVLLARLILGFCIGTFWGTAVAVCATIVPKGVSFAKANTILMSGVALASAVAVPIGVGISNRFGWQTSFLAFNSLGVIVLLLQAWSFPKIILPAAVRIKDIPILLFKWNSAIGLLVFILLGLAHFAGYSYIAPLLKQSVQPDTIAALLFGFGIAGIFGNIFSGYLSAKSTHLTFWLMSLGLFALLALLPLLNKHFTILVILVILWGFVFSMLPVWINAWVFEVVPEDLAKAMPSVSMAFQAMILSGSFLGGVVVDNLGINPVFYLAACVALAAGVIKSLVK